MQTPSATATHPACSDGRMRAVETRICSSEMLRAPAKPFRTAPTATHPNPPAAATIPGSARFQGKGIGGGAAASSRTRSITEARKPDEGANSSSAAKI